MAEKRTQRRLAAILAADVVGYSRLMEADEAATLAALKSWQLDTLHPQIANHGGRVVKLMGDGVLAEFASAVDAVQCAVALQAERGAAPGKPILLRIGVNLGDVVVDGDDLYGDGVNLAARIEALAEPGGVYLSQAVFDQVQGKVDIPFEDTGEHSLKNIARPVRVYRATVAGAPERQEGFAPSGPAQPGPNKLPRPAVAILPFISMSADADRRFLADGVTEDIITELSRFTSLTVIARNSSFRYRDQPVDVKRIRRELGARYVVEGSLRPVGDSIRITAQLIDAETGGHLWAERFDRPAADFAGAQDEMLRVIVVTTANRIAENEEASRRLRSSSAATAYDHLLQGREMLQNDYLLAEAPLRRAIELDPEMSEAHALLVYPLLRKYAFGDDPEPLQEAARSARRAIALNPRGSGPQFSMAVVASLQSNYELAGHHFDRSIALNANNAVAQIGRAQWLLWGGRAEEALAWLELTIPGGEMGQGFYLEVRGEILYQLRRYREAIDVFGRLEGPLYWIEALVIAALAEEGRLDEARQRVMAMRESQPKVTIARVLKMTCYKDDAMHAHLVDGLRKAGMVP